MKKVEEVRKEDSGTESRKEEAKKKDDYKIPLRAFRIIPWIIPKRDGRHEMVFTRLPIHTYYFHTIDYVTIYLKLVKTDVNVIDSALVGTFPVLVLDPADASKVTRTNRPVTLALLSKEEVRAVTQNIDLPEVTKEVLDAGIDALEGFRSLELQRENEFLKRELAAERKESLKKLEDNVALSEKRFWHFMEVRHKGHTAAKGVSKTDKVRQVIDSFKFRVIVGMLFVLGIMYWLGWIF